MPVQLPFQQQHQYSLQTWKPSEDLSVLFLLTHSEFQMWYRKVRIQSHSEPEFQMYQNSDILHKVLPHRTPFPHYRYCGKK